MTDEELKALLDADGPLMRAIGVFLETIKNAWQKIKEKLDELKKAVAEDGERWPSEIVRKQQTEKTREGFPRVWVTPDP